MGKKSTSESKKRVRPALTPESRENQLIARAMDLAEQQLIDGTASNQVLVHFLKLGTQKYRYETEKLRNETKLVKAKTEAIESSKRSEELFEEAIEAMKSYTPGNEVEE